MTGIGIVLETLNAQYVFDARGRLHSAADGGVSPRFVLGRSREGCVWRFREDLEPERVVRLARLAGREGGAAFDGELPAPPERLGAMGQVLAPAVLGPAGIRPPAPQRTVVTREGVAIGELWRLD